MNLNENLKKLRKYKSQKAISQELGISYANYNKYETTNTMPDIETLIKIADYYKITLDDLVGHDIPFLVNKSLLSNKQNELLNILVGLTDRECERVQDFIQGMNSENKK